MSFLHIKPLIDLDDEVLSRPVAGFDIDHTLIKPKSGHQRADNSDPTDWVWLYPNTVDKLTELHESGKYRVIAFTNQGSGKFDVDIYKTKIKAMQQDVPFLEVRVAHGGTSSVYRKPSTKMWFNGVDNNDPKKAFYVGDAAGRYKSSILETGDHDACDILFAYNLGIPFYLPEEFFRNDYSYRTKSDAMTSNMYIDHKDMLERTGNVIGGIDLYADQYVLCMVGIQAAGKSTFSKNLISMIGENKLTMVGNDADLAEEEVRLEAILESGMSCIVDAINTDASKRARWVKIAKKHNVPIICVHMTTNRKMAIGYNSIRSKHISEGALNRYNKEFQEPTTSEGFVDIVKIKGHMCI